jgi:two-component system cell cycle response regulator DivK
MAGQKAKSSAAYEPAFNYLQVGVGLLGPAGDDWERPDLILMDLSLPVVDGWEATRRIRANDRLKHIPIIALTAHAMVGDAERALACGCDDYMTRPLNEDLLFEKLE